MVQPPWLAAVQELKSLPSPDVQLQCLRQVKNDIIGHEQRKELVVRHGVLEPLAQILASSAKASGKRATQHTNGSTHTAQSFESSWSIEDEIRLQATLVAGSLASGGPAFVSPLLLSNVVQFLILALSPGEAPDKLVTATLRSLHNIAVAWSALYEDQPPFLSQLYNRHSIDNLNSLICRQLSSSTVQQQVSLAAELVSLTCRDDSTGETLVKAGVLDGLAAHLVESNIKPHNLRSVLNALTAVVGTSAYRTCRLMLTPSLRKLSPSTTVDQLLPKVLAPHQKSVSFGSQSFPALSGFTTSRFTVDQSVGDVQVTSPFFAWLLYLARAQRGTARLAALRLLARVNAALSASSGVPTTDAINKMREKERQVALLAIPLAVQLVQEAATGVTDPASSREELAQIKEQTCLVLAELVNNSPDLQKAAVEASAIKYISQILKRSFDSVSLARPMWSAQANAWDQLVTLSPVSTLGSSGLPPEVTHAMKCRQGALEALGSLANKEDSHRKSVIDNGVIQNIIDSLTPFPDPSAMDTAGASTSSTNIKDGNTVAVLMAACHAAKSMSRSVSLLRTSLIDAGVAKPVFKLLHHSNNAVQVAATDVTINLVLEFSPMRQDLIDAGVMQTLCNHAKRSSTELRRASLWALKHLVLNAPKEMKIACLEELGTGWLIQAIQGEHRTEAPTTHAFGMGTSNAAGEQVDLLNTPESPEMDLGLSDDDNADEDDGEIMYDHNGTRYQSSGIRSTLKTTSTKSQLRILRENESNPHLRAQRDDIYIQEQALDFVRNLINGEESTVMIQHLNMAIGSNRLFDLLYSKLKPLQYSPGHTPSQRLSSSQSKLAPSSPRNMYQPPEILHATIMVIVHLSAGSAPQKHILIAQKQLLHALLPHFTSPERRIRVACVWAVNNLTWREDSGDSEGARARALDLRMAGIEEKVRALANDNDLDVRERTKTAVKQIDDLLEGPRQVLGTRLGLQT